MDDNILDDDNAFFVYMGEGGGRVPDDVIHARVHPTVTVIPFRAFYRRAKLEKVELCEGLREIGEEAFKECTLLKEIKTPSTVTAIHTHAFSYCSALSTVKLNEGLLEIGNYSFSNSNSLINIPTTIQTIGEGALISANIITLYLPDAIESIGEYAFYMCSNFANFRCPPLVATIPRCIFSGCKRVFSVEIPEHVILIEYEAFVHCNNLRNLALSHGTVMGRGVFINCTDLLRVFDTVEAIIIALSSRFDGLIIHKMCYYKSYHPMALLDFIRSTSVSSGKGRVLPRESNLIESGKQQDCLGMTPLHILACSTVHHLEIYSFVIDQYPETLIMEDAWGAVPLL
jgi:hypothetical protein